MTSGLYDQLMKRRRDINPGDGGGKLGHADDIQSDGQVGFALAKRLTDTPLDLVPPYGIPQALADADPDSRISQVVSHRIHHEHCVGGLAPAAEYAGEVPAQAEVFTFRESRVAGHLFPQTAAHAAM